MGLFSSLMGSAAVPTLDKSTAVMIPMVAAMTSDGDIDDDEIRQIRSICVWSPIYAHNSMDQDTDIILRAIRMIKDLGAEAMCVRAGELLSPALRETAFCFAVRLAFADGFVGTKEQDFVERLMGWLAVDPARAQHVVEVITMMQHGLDA
ncbi:tellurite resistance TerB family protein [Sphingomonas sp.]|jgi:hypothetical protein|uniref:tellurite resistance TerB family protein n=1 Tax=Sphingomonas sp. TaxID=28214 RepID=UPI002ED8EC80